MAIIQYTGIVNQIRGKLNGSVFNKSKNGYTLQRAQAPRKGATPDQAVRRGQFAFVQRSYKDISEAEKQLAAEAAVSNPVFDRFGELVVLSGYNQWVKANVIRVQADLPILPDLEPDPAPSFGVSNQVFTLTLRFLPDGRIQFNVRLQGTVSSENQNDLLTVFEIAQPQSRGVESPPSGFLRINDIKDDARYQVGAFYNKGVFPFKRLNYPVPGTDQEVPIRVQFWRASSGSLVFEALGIVTPTVIIE